MPTLQSVVLQIRIHGMLKVFIIILLGLVLMTGRMQLKGKLSDKIRHEAKGADAIFGNMPTFLTMMCIVQAIEHQNTRTPTAI